MYMYGNNLTQIEWKANHLAIGRGRPIMLIFYLLCYAAVLIKFTYYAQNYAQK